MKTLNFQQFIVWKMPNNYEQFIEWQFLEICIVVKHSRWKKRQNKKAEAEIVFIATKKFEE